MNIDFNLQPADLKPELARFWDFSGRKIDNIARNYDLANGSPVFTAVSYTHLTLPTIYSV